MKRTVSLILCLIMIISLSAPALASEPVQSRVVIGADLTNEQVASVYASFGIRRGQAIELKVTNAEERRYLQGAVDSKIIGTRSISCVYVELLPKGRGMSVKTNNITWCTGRMYVNALATAGITDARILVSAPFAVSGTAALTGVYKAYEDMTGMRLTDSVKLASSQELAITGSLAQAIGNLDSIAIVNDLKLMLSETKQMSDEGLRRTVAEIAGRYNVKLTDAQIQQLVTLCRTMESLDPEQLRQRVQQAQDAMQKLSEAKSKLEGFAETVKGMLDSIAGFLDSVREFLDRFKS